MKLIPEDFLRANSPAQHYALAMHLISEHCNAAAVHTRWEQNAEAHWYEHSGPGGLRLHGHGDLAFDEYKAELVLEEAEAERASFQYPDFQREQDQYQRELHRKDHPLPLDMIIPGHDPVHPKWHHQEADTDEGSPRRSLLVQLTEQNWASVQDWLARYGISANWNPGPPRLSFGGRLGLFCTPPGYWVALTVSPMALEGYVAEAISPDEFRDEWARGHG